MISCIRGCARRRHHFTDCMDATCRGCLPREAHHGGFCVGCHNRIEQAVTHLVPIRTLLLAHLAPTMEQGELIRGSGEPAAPLNIAVLDLLMDFDMIPAQWARLHAEEHDLHGPATESTADASSWLTVHLASIECADWVTELWRELLGPPDPDATFSGGLIVRAAQIVPWREQAIRLGAPCPDCHSPALILYGGDDWVTCRECDAIIPRHMYDHWARVVLQERTRDDDHETGSRGTVGGACDDPLDGAPRLPAPRESGHQAPAVP